MASVLYDNQLCPVCGHYALTSEWWYRRNESAEFCDACGYSRDVEIVRDSSGDPAFYLHQTYDLEKDFIFLGKKSEHHLGPVDLLEEFVSVERVTTEMSTEQLSKRIETDGKFATSLYLRDADSRITCIIDRFSRCEIRLGKLLIYHLDWEIKEDGGYGNISFQQDGITFTHQLSKDVTIQEIVAKMSDEDRSDLKELVVFSPRGENPQFYNTTAEEFFSKYDAPYVK